MENNTVGLAFPPTTMKTAISTAARRTAFRETGLSRHHGNPVKEFLKPLKHHDTIVPKGLRAALHWAPIIDRKIIYWITYINTLTTKK